MRYVLALVGLLCGCGVGDYSLSAECKAYVSCYEATGGTKGTLDSTYGAMGNCWATTPQRADVCIAECKVRNDELQQIFPDAGCKDK